MPRRGHQSEMPALNRCPDSLARGRRAGPVPAGRRPHQARESASTQTDSRSASPYRPGREPTAPFEPRRTPGTRGRQGAPQAGSHLRLCQQPGIPTTSMRVPRLGGGEGPRPELRLPPGPPSTTPHGPRSRDDRSSYHELPTPEFARGADRLRGPVRAAERARARCGVPLRRPPEKVGSSAAGLREARSRRSDQPPHFRSAAPRCSRTRSRRPRNFWASLSVRVFVFD